MGLLSILLASTPTLASINHHNISTITEIQEFYRNKGAVYPKIPSKEYDLAFNTIYTSPQTTLNRGFGVCDDLSLLTAYMLLNVPYITEIDLIQVTGEVSGKQATHAYLVFKDTTGLWGYANNNDVSSTTYLTKGQALLRPIRISGIRTGVPYFSISERKINYQGTWVYDDNAASKLNPTTTHPTLP